MPRIKTFLFYLDSKSFYYKTPFFVKFLLFFLISSCGLLLKNYYINAIISAVLVILIFQSGFVKERPFYLILLSLSSIMFCSIWLFLSKVTGAKIFITFPWGTYISDHTIDVLFSSYFRWLVICLAGLFLLVISYQEELIEEIIKLRFPYQLLLVLTLAFNTVSFTLEDFYQIQLTLNSRNIQRQSLFQAFNRILYIGVAFLMDNIKRISMLRISYFLDMDDIIRTYGHDHHR